MYYGMKMMILCNPKTTNVYSFLAKYVQCKSNQNKMVVPKGNLNKTLFRPNHNNNNNLRSLINYYHHQTSHEII